MIEELIEQGSYEAALDLLSKEDSDIAKYQRVICYSGLRDYPKVVELASKLIKEPNNRHYYDVLSLYIVALIKTNQQEEAMQLLEAELKMPFIPGQFEDFFETTYRQLKLQKEKGNINRSPYDLYTDEQLQNILLTTSKLNELAPVVQQLGHRNIRNFLAALEVVLMNKDVAGYLKSIIIELLRDQNVSQEFEYADYETEIRITPTELLPVDETEAYQAIMKGVSEQIAPDNVSLSNVAKDVALLVLVGTYPFDIEKEEYDYYVAAIECVATKMFGMPLDLDLILEKYDVEALKLDEYVKKATKLNDIY